MITKALPALTLTTALFLAHLSGRSVEMLERAPAHLVPALAVTIACAVITAAATAALAAALIRDAARAR